MHIELTRQQRTDSIASLKRYFDENLTEPLGDLPAGMLLDYVLQELGPLVYNQAINDAQARLNSVVADLTGDLYEKPLAYWPAVDARRKRR